MSSTGPSKGACGALVLALLVLFASPSRAQASARIVVQPTQGPPNSTVAISGADFCATCGPVFVTLGGSQAGSFPVSADGGFTGCFTVPPVHAGSQSIVASQPGGPSASTMYFVAPNQPASNPCTPSAPAPESAPTTLAPPPTSADTTESTGQTTTTEFVDTSTTTTTTAVTPSTTAESSQQAAGASSTGHDGGRSWWPLAVVGAVVVIAATTGVIVWRRRASTPQQPT